MRLFSIALLFSLLAPPAMALDCTSTVVDGAGLISDVGKVESAAKALGSQGVRVLVRTYGNLSKDVSKQVDEDRDACPTWQNGSGKHFANNLIVLSFAPPTQIAMGFGIDTEPLLGHRKWIAIVRKALEPAVVKYNQGDKGAITQGFVQTMASIDGVLAQPVLGGNTTVNQAADYSGLWKVFFALVLIIAFVVCFSVYMTWKSGNDAVSSARANARRVQSTLISAVNDLSAQMVMLETKASAKPELQPLFADYKRIVDDCNVTINQFTDLGSTTAPKLSAEAYASDQARYEEIMQQSIRPARSLARQIDAGKADTPAPASMRQPPPRRVPPRQAPPQPAPLEEREQPFEQRGPAVTQRPPFSGSQPSGISQSPPFGGTPSYDNRWNQPAPQPPPQYTPPTQPPAYQNGSSFDDGLAGGFLGGVAGGMLGETLARRPRDDDDNDRRERQREREDRERDRQQDREDDERDRRETRSSSKDDDDDDGGSFSASPSSSTDDDADDDGGSFSVDSSSASSDDGGSFSSDDNS